MHPFKNKLMNIFRYAMCFKRQTDRQIKLYIYEYFDLNWSFQREKKVSHVVLVTQNKNNIYDTGNNFAHFCLFVRILGWRIVVKLGVSENYCLLYMSTNTNSQDCLYVIFVTVVSFPVTVCCDDDSSDCDK